jgi:hypothetical protein
MLEDGGRAGRQPGGPIVLRSGPYGVHAYLLGEDGPGDALEISSALPMIRAGADVYVARPGHQSMSR